MLEIEPSSRGPRGRVVIADKTRGVANLASSVLARAGYECEACDNGQDAVGVLNKRGADVLLADLTQYPPGLLGQLRSRHPDVALVALTFNPNIASAVSAMRNGAFDYLVKPFDDSELCTIVDRAIEIARLRRENQGLRSRLEMVDEVYSFVAESPVAKQLVSLIRRVAPTNAHLLIEGEAGTGKDLVARMIHYWSDRSEGPFVSVSCKDLGAQDPAPHASNGSASSSGRYEMPVDLHRAIGGTLVIDDLAAASPSTQAELVNLLSAGPQIGSNGSRQARIVAITASPLRVEMEAGRLRADLFFKLSALTVRIPPLRNRREDIIPLARRILSDWCARHARVLTIGPDAERDLLTYQWPGNLLELRSIIERVAILSTADSIESVNFESLSFDLNARGAGERIEPHPVAHANGNGAVRVDSESGSNGGAAVTVVPGSSEPDELEVVTLQECLDRAARERIKSALDAVGGNRSAAAKALEVDGTTLGRLIKRLGI